MATTNLQILIKLRDQASAGLKGIQQQGSKLGNVMGTVVKAGAIAGGAAIVGAGAAVFKAGLDFDKAYDKIRTGTGATGKALEDLNKSFKDVFTAVPTSMDAASTAIADLNTRTGATGELLEGMAKQLLEMSRLTGTDVQQNIVSVTRTMGDWGVSNEDAALAMDKLFHVSQATGPSIDEIGRLMVQYGAPLRQMGFGFDEAAAMMGKFQKEGVNTELVMGSMRIGLVNLAKAGEEPSEAFGRIVDEIKNMGSQAEANARAVEIFGARAGPDMAAAIREGRFEIEDLVASLDEAEGAINRTAEDTDSFGEKFKVLKNKITVAIEPMAIGLVNMLTDWADAADKWFTEHQPQIEEGIRGFRDFFNEAKDAATPFFDAFVEGTKTVAPLFKDFGNWIVENKPAIVLAIAAIGTAIVVHLGPLSAAALALSGIVTLLGAVKSAMGDASTDAEKYGWNLSILSIEELNLAQAAGVLTTEQARLGRNLRRGITDWQDLTAAEKKMVATTGILTDKSIWAEEQVTELDAEVRRMRRTFIDTKQPIEEVDQGLGDIGGSGGSATTAAAGLSDTAEAADEAEEALTTLGEEAIDPITQMFKDMRESIDAATSSLSGLLGIQTEEEAQLQADIDAIDLEIEKIDQLAGEKRGLTKLDEQAIKHWEHLIQMREEELESLEEGHDEERQAIQDSIDELQNKIDTLKALGDSETAAGKAARLHVEDLESQKDTFQDELDEIEATKKALGSFMDAQVEGRPKVDELTGMVYAQAHQLGLWKGDVESLSPTLRNWYATHSQTVFDICLNFNHLLLFQRGFVDDSTRLANEWADAWARAGGSAVPGWGPPAGVVPSIQSGGYITRTGLAYLHAGETVTPAHRAGGEIHIHVLEHGIALGERREVEALWEQLKPYLLREFR